MSALATTQTWERAAADLKGLPVDYDAEHAVLGCLMIDNELLWECGADKVRHHPAFEAIHPGGGKAFLIDLAANGPPSNALKGAAETVVEMARLRELMKLGAGLAAAAKRGATASELIGTAEAALLAIN